MTTLDPALQRAAADALVAGVADVEAREGYRYPKLAALPVGGFVDDDLNGLLRLDGVQEAVLYLVLVAARA